MKYWRHGAAPQNAAFKKVEYLLGTLPVNSKILIYVFLLYKGPPPPHTKFSRNIASNPKLFLGDATMICGARMLFTMA